HWILSHKGIDGNEEADAAAKEATGWRQTRTRNGRTQDLDTNDTALTPNGIKHLRAAIRTTLNTMLQEAWKTAWKDETRGRTLHRLTPTPTRKVLNIHNALDKALSAIITQLRTGKIGFRQFL